jgi:nicotinamidase-related amidase
MWLLVNIGAGGLSFLYILRVIFANGDVLSSFENTDLEFQLRQRDINKLIFAGMETSACVESTARVAYERGFNITML